MTFKGTDNSTLNDKTKTLKFNLGTIGNASKLLKNLSADAKFSPEITNLILKATSENIQRSADIDTQELKLVFGKLDPKTFEDFLAYHEGTSQNSFSHKHRYFLQTFPEIIEEFYLKRPAKREILDFYKRNNKSELAFNHYKALEKNGTLPHSDIELGMFLETFSEEHWKAISNSQSRVRFNLPYTSYLVEGKPLNILEFVAINNPKIYQAMEKDFSEYDILKSENVQAIITRLPSDAYPIFKSYLDQFDKDNISKKIINLDERNGIIRRLTVKYIIENIEFENWTKSDESFVIDFFKIHNSAIWKTNSELNSMQSTYLYLLKNTSKTSFIEDALYFSITCSASQHDPKNQENLNSKLPITLTKMFLNEISQNDKISNIKLLNILGENNNLYIPFLQNKHGIADLVLNHPKLSFKMNELSREDIDFFINNTEAVKNIVLNANNSIAHLSSIEELQEVQNTFVKMVNKFNKDCNQTISLSEYGFVLCSEDLQYQKTLIKPINFYGLYLIHRTLNNRDFNNLIHKIDVERFNSLSNNDLSIQALIAEKILDRVERSDTFKNCEKDTFENFTKYCAYTISLMEKGKLDKTKTVNKFTTPYFDTTTLKRIFELSQFTANEILSSSAFIDYLYTHLKEDFTKYGLDNNNPNLNKNLIEKMATSYYPEFGEKYSNFSYKYPNGDNLLFAIAKNNEKNTLITFLEIVNVAPELLSEKNKKGQYPLNILISNIKKMSKPESLQTPIKKLNFALTKDLNIPIKDLSELYCEFKNISKKIEFEMPNWETILQKHLIQCKIEEGLPQVKEDNNDWKL